MWPVSQTFLTELKQSHQVVCRADILQADRLVASDLKVVSGSVDIDASAATRRRCSCKIVDDTGLLFPNDAADVLSPYGYEIRLFRGIRLSTGVDELIPLGTFRISSSKVSTSDRTIDISGYDRARVVSRARLETPYVVASNTNYVTAIQTLISSRYPSVQFAFATREQTTGLLAFDQMADPWASANDMASAISCELLFDPMGVCVLRNEPNPVTDQVVASYVSGSTATVLDIENALDDEPGYNGVVVDGEPQDLPPVHSVFYDNDPTSPTYYLGAYGRVPQFYRSIMIRTQQQADDTAAAMLRRKLGGSQQLSFTAIPNPAHEAGDCVVVQDTDLGVSGTYVMQSFSIPLDVEAEMKVTTRKRGTL